MAIVPAATREVHGQREFPVLSHPGALEWCLEGLISSFREVMWSHAGLPLVSWRNDFICLHLSF